MVYNIKELIKRGFIPLIFICNYEISMTEYNIKQITIQEKPEVNESGELTTKYIAVGVLREKNGDTISQHQTEKTFDKLGDALVFIQEFTK